MCDAMGYELFRICGGVVVRKIEARCDPARETPPARPAWGRGRLDNSCGFLPILGGEGEHGN